MGQDKPVIAPASGKVDLHVYRAGDETDPPCAISDAFCGCSFGMFVIQYRRIDSISKARSSTGFSSGATIPQELELELQIVDHDFLAMTPWGQSLQGRAHVCSTGSTFDGATIDSEAPSCGSASRPTASGVWYTIIGHLPTRLEIADIVDGTNDAGRAW